MDDFGAEERPVKRRTSDVEITWLHERLEEQSKLLIELSKKIDLHLAAEAQIAPALQELVTLWKGSKLIIPIASGVVFFLAAMWGLVVWAKDHLR